MAIVRWTPFGETADVRNRLNWWLGGDDGPFASGVVGDSTWLPPADIRTGDNHEFLITVELPDVRREDIDLTVEDHTLTLRGEKKIDPEIRHERFHRVERSYGTFRRSFTLPNTVDAAKVRAEYRDGVLTLRLPLREETKPRQVAIETSA